MRYNPALDGLRGVAIIAVIACHSMKSLFPGGWLGVDIFFVLSGYLITSILLNELQQTGEISLTNFYVRRALRLLPALTILAAIQIGRSVFSHNGTEIREATIVGVLYLENLNQLYKFAPFELMEHTWSLATEEQFYLLWPLVLQLIFRKNTFVWLTVALVAMVFATYWSGTLPRLYSPLVRPVGLVIGCFLAFLPVFNLQLPSFVRVAALSILMVIVFAGAGFFYIFSPLAVSLATAVLIIGLNGPSVLSVYPLRYVGKISYGLYIYHWPIFMYGERFKPHASFHLYAIGLIVIVFIAAVISYEFVEKPFLRLKDKFDPKPALDQINARLSAA